MKINFSEKILIIFYIGLPFSIAFELKRIHELTFLQNLILVAFDSTLFVPSAPWISIVMCFYKNSHFIPSVFRSCIDNQYLIEQQLHIELICIDDASNDDTLSKLNSAKQMYDSSPFAPFVNFRIFSFQENMGLLYGRHFAYSQATGSYIFAFDNDDELIPGILAKIYALTKNRNDIEALSFLALEVYESDRTVNSTYQNKQYSYKTHIYRDSPVLRKRNITLNAPFSTGKFSIINKNYSDTSTLHLFPPAEFKNYRAHKWFMWNLCFTAFKRSIVQKGLPYFDQPLLHSKYSFSDDFYAFYTYMYFVHRIHILDEIGYAYYQYPNRPPKLSHRRQLIALRRYKAAISHLYSLNISVD